MKGAGSRDYARLVHGQAIDDDKRVDATQGRRSFFCFAEKVSLQ